MMMMMMMMIEVVLVTKVPLFSKVNQNSGSRTFSALLMMMMTILDKNYDNVGDERWRCCQR